MDAPGALRLARSLVAEHGLRGWSVGLDRAVRRAGATHYRDQRITLSRHLVGLYTEDEVREVILHEIGHALAGAQAGHGPRWRAAVVRIGGTPRRTTRPDSPTVPAPWVGRCPAGHEHQRFQRPRATYLCRRCPRTRTSAAVIEWTYVRGAA
ncbi:SprT-like domain-containing protein [Georgenia sp. Z1344]|uniref:SprT-like domain-containing protein n=1 Tax=Georgenia sp. Z1344 TaxID=3416706 RepID=UPI003CE6B3D1